MPQCIIPAFLGTQIQSQQIRKKREKIKQKSFSDAHKPNFWGIKNCKSLKKFTIALVEKLEITFITKMIKIWPF